MPRLSFSDAPRTSEISMSRNASLSSSSPSRPLLHRHSIGVFSRDSEEWVAHETLRRLSTTALSNDAHHVPAPETILMRTNVRLVGVARHDRHCTFIVHVDTGREQYLLDKRYSEFRDFRRDLQDRLTNKHSHCGSGPCKQLHATTQVKFPRRRLQLKKDADLALAQERMYPLERYMEAVLRAYRMTSRRSIRCCIKERCGVLSLVEQFLEIPVPRPASPVPAERSPMDDLPSLPVEPFLPVPRIAASTMVSMQDDLKHKFQQQQQLCPILEELELLMSMEK